MSATKDKILLSLFTGIALGFTYSPQRQFRLLQAAEKAFKDIDRKELRKKIRELYRSKLVAIKENPDDTYTLELTDKGKMKTLTYHFQNMRIKKEKWDGKWRLVIFDIPEKFRQGRDTLRAKLRVLGFHELQKSVFIFPYHCQDEIEFLVEFFQLKKYVRFGILESIDNELHLKEIFAI